jgi:hypothetical protein
MPSCSPSSQVPWYLVLISFWKTSTVKHV